jgi:NAD(P)-dependent dehydrogenase (short-subunit alcohol dehydrogenase family)
VDRVFGNPGTTELPFLAALAAPEYVLGIHEAAVVSIADRYARATGRPAFVGLHIAAGLANGLIGSLIARRSRTPLEATAGQQDRRHLQQDPMLSGDLIGLARPAVPSAAVLTAPPTMVAYDSPKAGLIGFTRAPASALGPYDITVNVIAPSMVRTATAERTVGAAGGLEHVRVQQAVSRTQEPSDPVSTLRYVVDEGSGVLTGQTLNVAGGSAYL